MGELAWWLGSAQSTLNGVAPKTPMFPSQQRPQRVQRMTSSTRSGLSASSATSLAMEVIPTSRYPGDPQGQAFLAGVKGGWVVKSVGGQDVLNEDFGKIMDLLDDEVADPRFSKSTALALEKQGGRLAEAVASPIAVTYAEIPGYVYKGAELKADGQDGFAR